MSLFRTQGKNWKQKSAETRVMGIYEHLVNHILNKYKTILLSSLYVMKMLLRIYFRDYDL